MGTNTRLDAVMEFMPIESFVRMAIIRILRARVDYCELGPSLFPSFSSTYWLYKGGGPRWHKLSPQGFQRNVMRRSPGLCRMATERLITLFLTIRPYIESAPERLVWLDGLSPFTFSDVLQAISLHSEQNAPS